MVLDFLFYGTRRNQTVSGCHRPCIEQYLSYVSIMVEQVVNVREVLWIHESSEEGKRVGSDSRYVTDAFNFDASCSVTRAFARV